jgi:hypothetical protein
MALLTLTRRASETAERLAEATRRDHLRITALEEKLKQV